MSTVETDLMAGALVIPADQIAPARRAIAHTLGVDETQVPAELAGLGFCTQWPAPPNTALVIARFTGELAGPADAVVAALAPFVPDGTTLDWEDNNGAKWRYLLTAGTVIEQVPATVWRDVGDTARRTGGLLAPLTFHRAPESYATWWDNSADQGAIADTLQGLSERFEIEYGLHSLMLEVFQSDIGVVPWLRVNGLARRRTPSYLVLDMDVAYDGDGVLGGVDVVASMHADSDAGTQWLTVSVYVDHPWQVFASDLPAEPREALAAIVDQAVDLINADIAEHDRFVFSARDILT